VLALFTAMENFTGSTAKENCFAMIVPQSDSAHLCTRDEISALTMAEILGLVRNVSTISRAQCTRKDSLLDHVLTHGSTEVFEMLLQAAQEKKERKQLEHEEKISARKRKRAEDQMSRRTARRTEEIDQHHDISKFLELPNDSELKNCYREFYTATSNAAVEMVVCGVCAREIGMIDGGVSVKALAEIPNSHRLVPKNSHPAHDLFNGRLLEPRGMERDQMGRTLVKVCRDCLNDLKRRGSNKPPTFSLSNNLWIGRIPWQLDVLTFPEQLLIVHVYPRVYVFKLYPKTPGHHPSALQRGMKGTVSSYDLALEKATSMVEGTIMPRPPSILASVITVTFIGQGKLSKHWLCHTFRVRWQFIYEALCWLKTNNPKYYGDITISSDHLAQLPEDDVPSEILGIVRQSTDTGLVDHGNTGYVPSEEDENEGELQ